MDLFFSLIGGNFKMQGRSKFFGLRPLDGFVGNTSDDTEFGRNRQGKNA